MNFICRLEDNLKGVNDTKETFGISSDNERIVLVEDFGEESQEYKDDDQLLNASEAFEERIEEPLEEEDYMLAESEVIHQNKSTGKSEDQFEIYEMMTENEEEVEQNEEVPQLCETPPQSTEAPNSVLLNKNVVDPDERYLMSCLPAFQRFTPQQKAYVRMGIERLFYEVEFENISEHHRSKRSRNS